MKKIVIYVLGFLFFIGQNAGSALKFSIFDDYNDLPPRQIAAIAWQGGQEMLAGAGIVIVSKIPKYISPDIETEEDQVLYGLISSSSIAGMGTILFARGAIRAVSAAKAILSTSIIAESPAETILHGSTRLLLMGVAPFMSHRSLAHFAPPFVRDLYEKFLGPSLYYWVISYNVIGGTIDILNGVRGLWGRNPNPAVVVQAQGEHEE